MTDYCMCVGEVAVCLGYLFMLGDVFIQGLVEEAAEIPYLL